MADRPQKRRVILVLDLEEQIGDEPLPSEETLWQVEEQEKEHGQVWLGFLEALTGRCGVKLWMPTPEQIKEILEL
jgi:hypothetical protein